jgi:protein ImuB
LALLVGPQRLELCGWAAGDAQQGGEAGLSAPVLRDYFIARSAEAGLLWIYRERGPHAPAAWYLHGIFA